jgi:ectoine hydroxylase-related dioxygenase (phytanoyl-CoA dioxygenase family)
MRALDEQGWVVFPDALSPNEIARLRSAFDDAPAQRDGTQHVALPKDLICHDARVLAAAAYVLEGPAVVRDCHGRNPLTGYGLQGLHADWMPRATVRPFFVVTAIWMLDDFRLDNGSTRLVPGSHLVLKPIPKQLAQPTARHPREIVVTSAAGSVLVFNGHTWHAGGRNDSQGPRRAVQMIFRRADPFLNAGAPSK